MHLFASLIFGAPDWLPVVIAISLLLLIAVGWSYRRSTVSPGVKALALSLKTGGIALLFRYLASGDKRWMSSDLGGYVGVPKRKKYLDMKHFLKHTWVYKALTN